MVLAISAAGQRSRLERCAQRNSNRCDGGAFTALGSRCSKTVARLPNNVNFPFPRAWETGRLKMQTQRHRLPLRRGQFARLSRLHETAAERRPGVLVFHEGLGLGEFAMARARKLAELGYVALAADMFGDRRQARNLQEVAKLVGDLRNEPETLRARGRAALATLAALPQVDASRLARDRFLLRRLGGA